MAKLPQVEVHYSDRVGWMRAAVLGANDGLLSTASLIIGVAAANSTRSSILIAGVAGLMSGAMAMAAGEYVSVHSQADTEAADLAREGAELAAHPQSEHQELAAIYVSRGLDPKLAAEVAQQLMAKDALGVHARDELGITSTMQARPIQAAVTSAMSFATGALLPLGVAVISSSPTLIAWVTVSSLLFLALLGGTAAYVGGAKLLPGALRVTFWGALAMATTAGVGALFGAVA